MLNIILKKIFDKIFQMEKKKKEGEEHLRNRVYSFFSDNKSLGKTFTVRHFMKEKVPRSTLFEILKRSEHSPAKRKKGSGRIAKKMNKKQVKKLKKAFDHKDGFSQNKAAKLFKISQPYVCKLLKKHSIHCRKKIKIPSRTEKQQLTNRAKCGNLYLKNPNISWIMDDESYFTLTHSTINGNEFFYSSNLAETSASIKYRTKKKFEKKLLVWLAVSDKGISKPIFRESGFAVNQNVYLGFLKDVLISFIQDHHSDNNYKFWPDLASSHYAKKVVEYLNDKKVNFVQKFENPANVPEVRPIEDFWSILKGKVYEDNWEAKNLNDLKNKIRLAIRKLDQDLVQKLMQSTSKRLNFIRNNDLIEKR